MFAGMVETVPAEEKPTIPVIVKDTTSSYWQTVFLINFLPGVGSLQARDKGFKEQLAAKYPDLKLVAEKVADGQADGQVT
jgi:ABC-type sugar transport system substrate-binding protein